MRYTQLSRQTVHNYTVMGLITEAERTDGRHRLYGEETFERLSKIEGMKARGMTLRQIRESIGADVPTPSSGGNAG
jgi:DNA-binding transcriptional MerR regulator